MLLPLDELDEPKDYLNDNPNADSDFPAKDPRKGPAEKPVNPCYDEELKGRKSQNQKDDKHDSQDTFDELTPSASPNDSAYEEQKGDNAKSNSNPHYLSLLYQIL